MLARARSDAYLICRLIQSDNLPPYFPAIHALCTSYMRSRCTYAMPLWCPTDHQLRQLQLHFLRPIRRLLHLPRSTNRHGVLAEINCPSFKRYRQYLLLRYTHRLMFPAAALDQLNPSLTAWTRDIKQYHQYLTHNNALPVDKRKPFCPRALHPAAAESIDTANEWNITHLLYDNIDFIKTVKQRVMEMTYKDFPLVPHRNSGDPTPMRIIKPQPSKSMYLYIEPNPIAYTRARLRMNASLHTNQHRFVPRPIQALSTYCWLLFPLSATRIGRSHPHSMPTIQCRS